MSEKISKQKMPIVFSVIVELYHSTNKKVTRTRVRLQTLQKEAERLKKAMLELGYLGVELNRE